MGEYTRVAEIKNGDKWQTFRDLEGMSEIVCVLETKVIQPLRDFKLLGEFQTKPLKGIFFQGDSFTGKTTMAQAIASEADVPFFKASATKFLYSDTPEKDMREFFLNAYKKGPSVVLITELEAVYTAMDNLEKPSTANPLLVCMEELRDAWKHGYVLMIGETLCNGAVDKDLLEWFDLEYEFEYTDRHIPANLHPKPFQKTRVHLVRSLIGEVAKVGKEKKRALKVAKRKQRRRERKCEEMSSALRSKATATAPAPAPASAS